MQVFKKIVKGSLSIEGKLLLSSQNLKLLLFGSMVYQFQTCNTAA
jgi:hypothetical protein